MRRCRYLNASHGLFVFYLFAVAQVFFAQADLARANTVAHYRFEEGVADSVAAGAGSILDASGNALNGTPVGNPTYRTSTVPGSTLALEFDGSGDAVLIPDNAAFGLTQSLTIEACINVHSERPFGGQIFFRGDSRGGFDPYFLAVVESDVMRFHIANALNQVQNVDADIPADVPLNQLVHVAGTLDNGTGDMKLYVNGQLKSQANTLIRPFAALTGGSPGLAIGSLQDGSFQFFDGIIDELRLSDEALTPTQFLSCAETESVVAPNHFNCYKAETPKDSAFNGAQRIVLNDQFESNGYDAVEVERLCAPANKTPLNFPDADPRDPVDLDGTHLEAYKIEESELSCGLCEGGVDYIEIQYVGTDPVSFNVDGKVTNTGQYDLLMNESFELFGSDKDGKMGSNIGLVDLGGSEIASFHTSCSRPIGVGAVSGDFVVVGGSSVRAGELGECDEPIPYVVKEPWDTCNECKGGASHATFVYSGPDSVVTVTDKNGVELPGSPGAGSPLTDGDSFEIWPFVGEDKLPKSIYLTNVNGTVEIHTSCSKPFGPGLVVGDYTNTEGASKDGGEDMCPVVRIDNQFGTEFLTVERPKSLLVPTVKDLVGPVGGPAPTDTDHYKCYDVKSLGLQEGLQVNLVDQFDDRDFEIDKAKLLCNPVEKTYSSQTTPILNEEGHLVCYKIKPLAKGFCALLDPDDPTGYPNLDEVCSKDDECGEGLFCEKEVDTQAHLYNQFGSETVNVKKAEELCVPSEKTVGLPAPGAQSCNEGTSCTVFVTSMAFTGDLVTEAADLGLGDFTADGLGAGDAICNHLAQTASLPGAYKVWASSSPDLDPESRFVQAAVPYVRTDGGVVATNWADLITPDLLLPINYSESAALVGSVTVWAATSPAGTYDGQQNCATWRTALATTKARYGRSDFVDSRWTEWTGLTDPTPGCSAERRLYCFQQ